MCYLRSIIFGYTNYRQLPTNTMYRQQMRNYEAPTKFRQVLFTTNTDNKTDKYRLITTDKIPTNTICQQQTEIYSTPTKYQ